MMKDGKEYVFDNWAVESYFPNFLNSFLNSIIIIGIIEKMSICHQSTSVSGAVLSTELKNGIYTRHSTKNIEDATAHKWYGFLR